MKLLSVSRGLLAGIVLALVAACGGGNNSGGTSGVAHTFVKRLPAESTPTVFSGLFHAAYHWQLVFRAGDMQAMGKINAISFEYVDAQPAVSCPGMTVKMGHTVVAAAGSTFSNNVQNGYGSLVTVLPETTIGFPGGEAGDVVTIPLTVPFEYNGVDNLVLDVERTADCSGEIHDQAAQSLPYDTVVYTTVSGDPTGTTATFAPNLTFSFNGGEKVAVAADRASNNSGPIAPAANGRSQYLILARDIKGHGSVTGIRFPLSGALSAPLAATYNITLSHVPAASKTLTSTTFAGNVHGTATAVATNVAVNLPVGTRYFWIPLTGSFNYDGQSNLLIDVEATVTSGTAFTSYQNIATSRILASLSAGDATGNLLPRTLEPTLRFDGGPLLVMSQGTATNSQQVLGAGGAGQIQSLYRNDRLGTGGTIRNVWVRLAGPTPAASTLGNYKLYMGHTSKESLAGIDPYAANMDENALVMSGTLRVPAGLRTGDWLKIPLNTPFVYDATRNLSILFTTDAGAAGNRVATSLDIDQFTNHSVGRNDNSVTTAGNPAWSYNGFVDLKLDLE